MNPLNSEEFINELLELKRKNPAAFAETVLSALKNHPDLAVSDSAPLDKKRQALDQLLKHFEEIEKYEDCAFIVDLKKRIEDGQQD